MNGDLIDLAAFRRARGALGADLIRILGYFRDDGARCIAAIEAAMQRNDAVALVMPAHTLKEDSRQFGARPLPDLAEEIEMTARRCVEHHQAPDELIERVVRLRGVFEATMALLEREVNPLVERRGFGRRRATA